MKKVIILLFSIILLIGCTTNDSNPNTNSVTISIEATGLSDDKLALNNSATFTAVISGFEGDASSLSYRWTLSNENGELSDGVNPLPNPSVSSNSIDCIGRTAGEEEIIVEVLDASNTILALASYSFTILPADDPGGSFGCFDQPKIVYKRGFSDYVCNYDGSDQQYIGIAAERGTNISPDGEWFAWPDGTPAGWEMKIVRCDLTDLAVLPFDIDQDDIPEFSPDSETLYFMRPHPNSEPFTTTSPGRPQELVSYDIATGELKYLTSVYQNNEYVTSFAVNPVTGEIAFYRANPDTGESIITILNPDDGTTQDFTTIPTRPRSMDFAPDGGDIIFAGNTGMGQGIYRLELTSGSQPLLLFPNPTPGFTPPRQPHYYDNGNRIVYHGSDGMTNSGNLWTIDANGNDRQLLLSFGQPVFLLDVLR